MAIHQKRIMEIEDLIHVYCTYHQIPYKETYSAAFINVQLDTLTQAKRLMAFIKKRVPLKCLENKDYFDIYKDVEGKYRLSLIT